MGGSTVCELIVKWTDTEQDKKYHLCPRHPEISATAECHLDINIFLPLNFLCSSVLTVWSCSIRMKILEADKPFRCFCMLMNSFIYFLWPVKRIVRLGFAAIK